MLTGEAAGTRAGPAVALSFVAAGIACGLAALCYAEFASTVPVAGSAYTFSYASLGELVAWIIGWDLILELALGAATVASGWSDYFRVVCEDTLGVALPAWIDGAHHNLVGGAARARDHRRCCASASRSRRASTRSIVAIKLMVVLLVIVAGLFYVKGANLDPFIPPSGSTPAPGGGEATKSLLQELGFNTGTFGVGGIFSAAALVFFAFIGFDIVATAAEETKNPQRDLPIGIFGSLAICTLLYVAVSLVVTGMVPYDEIKLEAPLAEAFRSVGESTIAQVISVGALAGLTTVTLILMMGQSRVFFAMSRDHLLPPVFSRVSKRFKTPYRTTIATGIAVALLAFFVELTTLAELVNIGTLFAFIVVALGVLVLRRTQPDLERAYRTPLVPLVPILAVLASLWLMLNLPAETWERFFIWMALGLVVYFVYSRRRSRLN